MNSIFLEFEEGNCFGKCKAYKYKVVIFQDGKVSYRESLENGTSKEFSLSKEEMKTLSTQLKEMNFVSLDNEYLTRIADFQKHYITYNEHKIVFHTKGLPKPLKSLYAILKNMISEKV